MPADSIGARLDEIEELTRANNMARAEEEFIALVREIGAKETAAYRADLERVAQLFFPKRRKRLLVEIQSASRAPASGPSSTEARRREPSFDPIRAARTLVKALDDISQHSLFQWETGYREEFLPVLTEFLAAASLGASARAEFGQDVSARLKAHSQEVFAKGFLYQTRQLGVSNERALDKAANGLERFLELIVAFYSESLRLDRPIASARWLRELTSGALLGVLAGFQAVPFVPEQPAESLLRIPPRWMRAACFLTAAHLRVLAQTLGGGQLADSLRTGLAPFLEAIDRLIDDATAGQGQTYLLPDLVEVDWERFRRLSVSLGVSHYPNEAPIHLETLLFLDFPLTSYSALQQAAFRDVDLLLASPTADIRSRAEKDPALQQRFLLLRPEVETHSTLAQQIFDLLRHALFQRRSKVQKNEPLRYNFSRGFPLESAFLPTQLFVQRPSVRSLLRALSIRTGVRVWCSIRRSGKTTSCRDLASSLLDEEALILQTAHSPNSLGEGDELITWISAQLIAAAPIRPGEFMARVLALAEPQKQAGSRHVLVFDEYETLFNKLRAEAEESEIVRYRVVQPLLNEFAAFARDNLLVLLGQQPNAHYILMDQNQLSGLASQDAFPLFTHSVGQTGSELSVFLSRILAERVSFSASLADALFEEAGGHPYLTAKLLMAYLDWQIERKLLKPSSELSGTEFEEFAAVGLTQERIRKSQDFGFFLKAAGEALGSFGLRHQRWLHAAYLALRWIGSTGVQPNRVSESDLAEYLARQGAFDGWSHPDEFIVEAQSSNFLQLHNGCVAPKVRVLARIAAAATPQVDA